MSLDNATQFVMAGPAAEMRSKARGQRGGATAPRYGMTMWFEVVVDHLEGQNDLGRWSACKGLGVNLEVEENIWSGGDNTAPYFLPKQVTYGKITLQRAMSAESSQALRSWLEHVAQVWISSGQAAAALVGGGHATSPGGDDGYAGTNVIIRLFAALGPGTSRLEVAKWELRNVIPVSWTGPELNSKGGDVAIETLTLVHRGFLGSTPAAGAKAGRSGPETGKLTLSYGTDTLAFQFNPVEIALTRTANDESPKEGQEKLYKAGDVQEEGKLNITMSDLLVEGVAAVEAKCTKLRNWTVPDRVENEKGTSTEQLKVLRIRMGAGAGLVLDEDVKLKQVECKFTRFTASGVPSRAKVKLTLVVQSRTEGQPGGSSGGRQGPAGAAGRGTSGPGASGGPAGAPGGGRPRSDAKGPDDLLRSRSRPGTGTVSR